MPEIFQKTFRICNSCKREISTHLNFCNICNSFQLPADPDSVIVKEINKNYEGLLPFDEIDFFSQPSEDGIRCPKCRSNQITANRKGFGWGKAVTLGIIGGFIGSRKVLITCLNCGHQWQAGKAQMV